MTRSEVDTLSFMRDQFREYYRKESATIDSPRGFTDREFAFLLFDEKAMFRHIGFDAESVFKDYLKDLAPAHVYYSSAYYSVPEADMDKKGWKCADLVFDIDADHIQTNCKAAHDRWACRGCGKEGYGSSPSSCPKCGSASLEVETWMCENCLESAKDETLKLLEILEQDFGFALEKESTINFSGNRGYHVHVYQDDAKHLTQFARRELIDYIRGVGLEAVYHGFSGRTTSTANPRRSGWSGRLGKSLYRLFLKADADTFARFGISTEIADMLVQSKEDIMKEIMQGQVSQLLRLLTSRNAAFFDRLIQEAATLEGSAIDTVVTADIHRLIRLPMTLHGKTGFKASNVPIKDLEGFQPLKKAVAFSQGSVKIHVSRAPEFRIGDEIYGPYHNQDVEIPLAPGMVLLCKGLAGVKG